MRLDIYITENGMATTRSEAQRMIRSGAVTVDGQVSIQCGKQVTDTSDISVDRSDFRYVSRGGLKLEWALKSFSVSVKNQVALDIGASTGGFTDCLLQHGAKRVYALENGSGQLDSRLLGRDDVVNIENTNARYITSSDFPEPITLVTMDVSFISQTLILPAVSQVLCNGGDLITLIKPQFEVGKKFVGGGGIVRLASARERAVKDVCDVAESLGFKKQSVTLSPIRGGNGNIEYLAYFKYEGRA